ncbi:MAG: helix-turn-helix domain-containing protein [Butyricicoccus sp.]|nr:helix-turn-helix domain-containing protein [Butyricicoccus sp.]
MNEVVSRLKEMKTGLGISNKELSDMSGVPIGTVNRVLAGRVEAPNLQTIRDMVQAMGGSMDAVCGITVANKESASVEKQPESPAAGISPDAIHAYSVLLAEREKEIQAKDRWLKWLFITCCVLGGLLVGVLIFDLVNPAIGFFLR